MENLKIYIDLANLNNELCNENFRLDYHNLSAEDVEGICEEIVEFSHDDDHLNETSPERYEEQLVFLNKVLDELKQYVKMHTS